MKKRINPKREGKQTLLATMKQVDPDPHQGRRPPGSGSAWRMQIQKAKVPKKSDINCKYDTNISRSILYNFVHANFFNSRNRMPDAGPGSGSALLYVKFLPTQKETARTRRYGKGGLGPQVSNKNLWSLDLKAYPGNFTPCWIYNQPSSRPQVFRAIILHCTVASYKTDV